MGLGTAFGAGVHAYNREKESQATAEHNANVNELTKMKLNSAKVDLAYKQSPAYARDQQLDRGIKTAQLETARMNAGTSRINAGVAQQESKMKMNVYNKYMNPSDKKDRANQYKAQTRQVGAQVGATVPNQQDEITKVANENIQLKQNQEDFQAKTTTNQVVGNMYRDISNGGNATDSYDAFNQVIGNDPVMSQLIKGPISSFNSNDEKQMNSLTSYAAKTLGEGYEEEELAMTVEGLKEMTKIGLIGWSQANGEVVDLTGAITAMGVTNGLPATDVKGVDNKATKAMEKGQKIYQDKMGLRETPVWRKEASLEKKIWNGQDPQEAMTMMELTGIKVPTELKEMVKSNSEIVADTGYYGGANAGEIKTAVDNQIEQLMSPGLSNEAEEELLVRASEGIDLMGTEADKKYYNTILNNVKDNKIATELVHKPEVLTPLENTKIDMIEQKNIEKPVYAKAQARITEELKLVDGLDEVMGELVEMEKGAGIVNEAMASGAIMKTLGIAPDLSMKLYNSLTNGDPISRETLMNTFGINSKLGKLLATYVKNTSGGAVSDEERTFLEGVLLGAKGGDSAAVLASITAFKEASLEAGGLKSDLKNKSLVVGIPSTMRRVTNSLKGGTDYRAQLASIKKEQGTEIATKPATPARESKEEYRKRREAYERGLNGN